MNRLSLDSDRPPGALALHVDAAPRVGTTSYDRKDEDDPQRNPYMRFDWNYDGLYQFGSFDDGPMRAWAFATETGFRFPATKWRPRLSLRTDVASGDKDATDPRLQAFNPLLPGNSYSGAIGLLGPTNLTDLTGTATFRPRSNLILSFETPSYWRTSPRLQPLLSSQPVSSMPAPSSLETRHGSSPKVYFGATGT